MHRILISDATPPSQLNPSIPPELNRICLKLLSRLASDRYPDMLGLTKDLRDWYDLENLNANLLKEDLQSENVDTTKSLAINGSSNALTSTLVIPRGLRAFSRKDSYFFIDLVPGIRDREGIPESLSHWKNWVCKPDYHSEWNRVGVISGPTGCGKSSLIRAGLIPMLEPQVTTVIIEATPDLTEKQLLNQLGNCVGLTTAKTLPEKVMEIRRGGGLNRDKRILIIIDQFEQWLHANPDPAETDLLQAIRQCDGRRVQCLLLIRDDFWLALSRFMKAVEAPLQLGRNATMVDLFDQRHAKNVLIEFGRGYGSLPAKPIPLTRDQEKFIEEAIQSLTIEGKVIPVQLSLFAEMVKSRDWTLATLRRLGGSVGIGSQFLSESFSVTYAPANQRLHEDAAKSVLKSMLPKAGTEIKTCRRTLDELRASSGYADRDLFNSLLTILESDLKLVTATDAYDRSRSDSSLIVSEPITYQLSHDFLVPSIRDWLSSQQKASWRGRVEQTIVQQAEYWSQGRQRRFLPSFWEWLQSLFLVPRRRLGVVEGEMMRARDRLSLMQLAAAGTLLLAGAWLTQTTLRALNLKGLISQLQVAETAQVERMLDQIDNYGNQGQVALNTALTRVEVGTREAFLLQIGQVGFRPELKSMVLDYALNQAELPEVSLACQALKPYAQDIASECWKTIDVADAEFAKESLQQQVVSKETHLRALVLLAALDAADGAGSIDGQANSPSDAAGRWTKYAPTVTKITVRAAAYNPNQYSDIIQSLQPISAYLIDVLSQTIGYPANDNLSFSALSLLRDFVRHDPRRQTSLCLHAANWQRPYIIPPTDKLDLAILRSELEPKPNTSDVSESEQIKAALRRATASILLLSVENSDANIWSIFQRANDLTCRSLAIQLATELQLPKSNIEQRLMVETDPGVLAALLQMLGNQASERPEFTEACRSRVSSLYREHPDAGVHSSAKWCLTQWNELTTINSISRSTPEQNHAGPADPMQWLVTPLGELMLKISGKQSSSIGRDFLISAHEVTIDQFRKFSPGRYFSDEFGPAGDCPANIIKWKDAIAYCNWLSEQDGLKPFYPSNIELAVSWQPSSEDLMGSGYRLPQEEEWELAARAGTITDRPFGLDLGLFVHYDWCLANQNHFAAKKIVRNSNRCMQTTLPYDRSRWVNCYRMNMVCLIC